MPSLASIPIIGQNAERLETAERSQLIHYVEHYRKMGDEWLRRQIIDNDRIDILATVILGYEVKPIHLALMRFQFDHPDSLQLVFRGAGKTTVCTITKGIHLVLKDPNLRILIASKTSTNAEAFLKEIKAHFEKNEMLARVFGEYYDPRKCSKWDNREIEVLPRTITSKEATFTVVGVDGTIVGKHYDVILSDDLVDEDNARTPHMREKTKVWYYKTLDPTLESPDSNIPHRGEHHRLGTRYHYEDLYGHLIENELAEHNQVIPALDEQGRSAWHEKYPPSWFHQKRRKAGLIIFNSQYMCDTEAMKGEIFQYDCCHMIEEVQLPESLRIWMGVDLAISEEEQDDDFAIVVLGTDKAENYYALDHYKGKLRFNQQTQKITEYYRYWDPVRCCIETNAYQKAQYQNLKDEDEDYRLIPKHQHKDKITRAWKLSALFEDNRVYFLKTGKNHLLVEALVLFPNGKKDLFDAFDLAVQASRSKKRKPRKQPGLM